MSDGYLGLQFIWSLIKIVFWVFCMGLMLERLGAIRDELRKLNNTK